MSELHTTIASELARGSSVTYYTVGISMRPLLSERKTHVTISPKSFSVGDILLYTRPSGQYVLHRLIKQSDGTCYMRGDNTYGLEPIPESHVLGVVTHIYRRGKMFDVNNKAYRTYVRVWGLLYPLRLLVSRIRQPLAYVWRKFKKGIRK